MLGEIVWNERTLGTLLGCGIPLAAIIGTFWYLGQKSSSERSENELKQRMVERGMSADEIERVLAAHGSAPNCKSQREP